LGVDLAGYERVDVEWRDAGVPIGSMPRKPTKSNPSPWVSSIRAIRSVRFYRDCERSQDPGGPWYGNPLRFHGGELLAEIEIPGWDHAAIPVAEGPVCYLQDFEERKERVAEALRLDQRFTRAIGHVPEAAAIPTAERTLATLENLEWWARDAQQREAARERHEHELSMVLTEAGDDYREPLTPWDRFARATDEPDREAAMYEITLHRLYIAEGADGRARPYSGDPRIPAPGRAKRKALTKIVGGRYKSERCVSTNFWGWRRVADADKAWHSGETVRELFEVRQNGDRTRLAFLRFSWSPRAGRKLVDVAETGNPDRAKGWCEALTGAAAKVSAQDPERVAARSEKGCFAAVERGCFVHHVGTRAACEKLAGGDVLVLALPPGWTVSSDRHPPMGQCQGVASGRSPTDRDAGHGAVVEDDSERRRDEFRRLAGGSRTAGLGPGRQVVRQQLRTASQGRDHARDVPDAGRPSCRSEPEH
jgi:hypothetical protein